MLRGLQPSKLQRQFDETFESRNASESEDRHPEKSWRDQAAATRFSVRYAALAYIIDAWDGRLVDDLRQDVANLVDREFERRRPP